MFSHCLAFVDTYQQGNGSSGGVERIEERKRIEDIEESSSCFSYRSEARMIRTIVRISIFTSEDTKRSGVSERVEIHTLMRIRMNNEVIVYLYFTKVDSYPKEKVFAPLSCIALLKKPYYSLTR